VDSGKKAAALLAAACMGGALTFGGLVACTLRSQGGFASFNPWLALIVFIPLSLAGVVRLLFLKVDKAKTWAVLAIVLGILGVGLLFYLEYSGRLVHVMMRPDRSVQVDHFHG
jgi:hypothetical protein